MKNKIKYLSCLIFAAVLILALIPSVSNAQTRRVEKHHPVRLRQRTVVQQPARVNERVVVRQPVQYREVIVHNRHYFYRGGAFYERGPNGYITIAAPIGARIDVLPAGCRIVHVKRMRYYFFGGVYYRFIPRERVYCVVERPV